MIAWSTFFGHWSYEPGVWVPAAVSLLLYVRGYGRVSWAWSKARRRTERWRAVSFVSALLLLIVALESPIDYWADSLLFIHMVQHLLLLVVVPPLLVVSAPWLPLWRGLPLSWRRVIARPSSRMLRTSPARGLGRTVRNPVFDLAVYAVALVAWHVPVLYDATLLNQVIHDGEHASFLVAGILYWQNAMDSPPLRARATGWGQVVYLVAGMFPAWMIAIALGLTPWPLYSPYVHVAGRPFGMSALADQQIAAGIMWVPMSIPATMVKFLSIIRWLGEDETALPRPGQGAVNRPPVATEDLSRV